MKETSDDLIALHVRLLDIAEKHFPQLVNMILVRGVRSIEANGSRTSVIVYEPPYDGVFVTLCHHVKTYVSESTNSVWSGTLPYDGSLPRCRCSMRRDVRVDARTASGSRLEG